MSYKAGNLSDAVNKSSALASGQVVVFAEGAAISGIVTGPGSLGPGVALINSTTGEVRSIIHSDSEGGIQFGPTDKQGLFSESSHNLTSLYHRNDRVFHANQLSMNMNSKQLVAYTKEVQTKTTDTTVPGQSSGATYDNVSATGLINLTINTYTLGIHYAFFNEDGNAIRVHPGASQHFITPTGAMPNNTYLELTSEGAYLEVMANQLGNLMVIGQLGDVNPQP